jgi:hypothetical protein
MSESEPSWPRRDIPVALRERYLAVTDFPRTPSGKVRKVDLRRQLRAGDL